VLQLSEQAVVQRHRVEMLQVASSVESRVRSVRPALGRFQVVLVPREHYLKWVADAMDEAVRHAALQAEPYTVLQEAQMQVCGNRIFWAGTVVRTVVEGAAPAQQPAGIFQDMLQQYRASLVMCPN